MADGMIDDCRLLLSRFESHSTVRFEIFSQIWKEMNFSFIHCGRKDFNGRIQIVDYLYRVVSSYLSSSCTFQYRVGALYCLYAIYHTQLCKPKIKIRMTLPMWKDLNDLHEQFRIDKLAYGSREAITCQERERACAVSVEANSCVELAYGAVEKLLEVHSRYQKLKKRATQGSDVVNPNTVAMISDKFPSELARDIFKFEDWKQKRCHQHVLHQPSSSLLMMPEDNVDSDIAAASAVKDETMQEETEEESRASIRKTLKQKSFSQVNKVSKSMRHLQPKASDDPGQKFKRKR
ncbi:snRNA-activating protein complex subunit 1 isoform X2 [Nematostella vectensis]|uniref:snRNA-activating protein complex subunit 1 isoform X2 n=1 Tax=Nematostella vectensis TaxID=45351 RepID=UPI00138FA6BF|nr:snRNA-activating protein complex subunit 1 isoform X2 [Nematostella vectensis]